MQAIFSTIIILLYPIPTPKTGGEAEKWLGSQLAKQGKAIEFLPESGLNGKSGDMHFDGKVWDYKYIPLKIRRPPFLMTGGRRSVRAAQSVTQTFVSQN